VSTMIATFDLPTESRRSTLFKPGRDFRGELPPWGFWGSLGWGFFAVATALFAVVIYTGFWMLTHQLRIPNSSDAAFGIVAGIVGSVAPVIVLVISVKSRQYPLGGYFCPSDQHVGRYDDRTCRSRNLNGATLQSWAHRPPDRWPAGSRYFEGIRPRARQAAGCLSKCTPCMYAHGREFSNE
jgi:hypothetical protein